MWFCELLFYLLFKNLITRLSLVQPDTYQLLSMVCHRNAYIISIDREQEPINVKSKHEERYEEWNWFCIFLNLDLVIGVLGEVVYLLLLIKRKFYTSHLLEVGDSND